MVGTRYRSTWRGQSAIPRLGFLLFILAVAIVGWPKLRLIQVGAGPPIPTIEGDPRPDPADGVLSTVDSVDYPIDGFDLEKKGDLEKASNVLKEDLAIDGQTRDLLSLMKDSSLRMSRREMPAYWELVRKTANSSFNELREVSNSKTKFNDFYSDPAKHRGELVSLDIVVRRVTRLEAESGNSAGIACVYEIWGSTEQSNAWLYVFITNTLPEGFNEKTLLRKKTTFAGYFLKLLAYHPGSASPNANPLLAPLMIGRFRDIQQATPTLESRPPWWASLGVTAIIVLATVFITVRLFLNAEQKKRRMRDHRKVLEDVDPTCFDLDRV